MDKFGRVLIIIFFLCIISLGLNIYIISKLNKPTPEIKNQAIVVTKTATPNANITTPPNIQTDLTQIKAEIRSLRDSLESTGLILQTPEP